MCKTLLIKHIFYVIISILKFDIMCGNQKVQPDILDLGGRNAWQSIGMT